MPDSTIDYYRALLNARNQLFRGTGSPRIAIELLYRVYSQTIQAIQRDFGEGIITAERADALTRQINARLNRMGRQFEAITENQIRRSMDLVVEAHQRGTVKAFESAGIDAGISVQWHRVPEQAVIAMNMKRGLGTRYSFRTLIRRRVVDLQEEVKDFVQSVVARGAAADRSARELATMMAGENSEIIAALRRTGNIKLDPRLLKQSLKAGEISQDEYKQIKSLLSDARRIVISEVNTAFREADTVAAFHSPVIGYLRWQTSGRHDTLDSSPDVCDIYEQADQFGLGPGVFPIGNFPTGPHPYCGCYSMKVFRDPSEWNQPKQTLMIPPTLDYAQFETMFEGKTENALMRQVDLANYWNRQAYEFARQGGYGMN